ADALVAAGAHARRPLDGLAHADLGLPVRADLGQVVRERIAGAGAVGAVNDRDRGAGQVDAGVQGPDPWIVPALDGAQVDVGQGGTVQLELVDALQVV